MKCIICPGQPLAPCVGFPDDWNGAERARPVRRVARFDMEGLQSPDGEGSLGRELKLQGVAQSLARLRRRAGAREFFKVRGGESLKRINRCIDAEQGRVSVGTANYPGA